jgi:CRP-like cAMP-binding protein
MPARARRNDPSTSHQAAADAELSGRAASHRSDVLDHVRACPGSTYREIARRVNLDPVEVMRRLGDLQRSGEVQKGLAVVCSVCGRRCSTWLPVGPDGQRELF